MQRFHVTCSAMALLLTWAGGCGDDDGGGAGCPVAGDDPAVDVDGNGVADCSENELVNGQLTEDATGWAALAEATAGHDDRDADDGAASGSLRVVNLADQNNPSFRAAEQCVETTPESRYTVAFEYFIPDAQEVSGVGAQVELALYPDPGCQGDPGVQVTPIGMVTDAWTAVTSSITTPRAGSVGVRPTVRKNASAEPAVAYFDNLLFYRSE